MLSKHVSCLSRREDISLIRKGIVFSKSVMEVESGGIVDEGIRLGFWRQVWHENLKEGDLSTLTTCLCTALLVIQLYGKLLCAFRHLKCISELHRQVTKFVQVIVILH